MWAPSDGYVYVVREEGDSRAYYFGHSNSREATRDLANLQLGNPRRLTLVAVVPGSSAAVSAVTRGLESVRLRGGWYRLPTHRVQAIVNRLRLAA